MQESPKWSLGTVFPMPLKSIINGFKIDLKSIPVHSHRPPCRSHGFPSIENPWKIDEDPWDFNPGKTIWHQDFFQQENEQTQRLVCKFL